MVGLSKYDPILVQAFLEQYWPTLPLRRRVLARFFDRYRLHPTDYDAWLKQRFHPQTGEEEPKQ